MLVFKAECRHLLSPAPVHDVHVLGAQPHRSYGGVDGRVARPNHHHARWHGRQLSRLVAGNQIERVGYARQLFAGDAELMNCAQANSQEDGIVVAFQFGERLWSIIVSK